MRLAHPTPVRLTPELLRRLDAWRGDAMSRSTAIRVLLERALKQ
jgi:metal-responsive CopG/Arc/MetJ family transcriptional regulator